MYRFLKPPLQLRLRSRPKKLIFHHNLPTPQLQATTPMFSNPTVFVFSRMSHKWNHEGFNPVRLGLFTQDSAFEIYPMVVEIKVHSFFLLSSIPLYECIAICLFPCLKFGTIMKRAVKSICGYIFV